MGGEPRIAIAFNVDVRILAREKIGHKAQHKRVGFQRAHGHVLLTT
jgi:hypothetical protein